MNYMIVKSLDVADGPGCRVSLFVSGCRRHCKGCFNSETWPFEAGIPYTKEVTKQIIDLLDHPYMNGFTVLGGEPFEPENIPYVHDIIYELRNKFHYDKSIWAYSGFTYEELMNRNDASPDTVNMLDVLVDGPFIEELKNLKLQYCGSENQRVIAMPTTTIDNIMIHDQYDFNKPIHRWAKE